MSAITWRNIDAPDLRAVAQIQQQGADSIQSGINSIGDVFNTMAENQLAYREKEMNQKIGAFNLELDKMTPEQLMAFRNSDDYSEEAFKARFGENVDLNRLRGDVSSAYDSSLDFAIKEMNYSNVQDAQADRAILPEYLDAVVSGNMARAQELQAQFKSPETAQKAADMFLSKDNADRQYVLDQQRVNLDAMRTSSSIALNNANIDLTKENTEKMRLANETAKQQVAMLSAFSNFDPSKAQSSGKDVAEQKEASPKDKSVKEFINMPLAEKAEYARSLFADIVNKKSTDAKGESPTENKLPFDQLVDVAVFSDDDASIMAILHEMNAQNVKNGGSPFPVNKETVALFKEQYKGTHTLSTVKQDRLNSNISDYKKQLQQTVTESKQAAYNNITEGNPTYKLAVADQLYPDITTDEAAIAALTKFYNVTLGSDNSIEGVSIPRFFRNLDIVAEGIKDANGRTLTLTPAQKYYLFTRELPNTGSLTHYGSMDKTTMNYDTAKALVTELSNKVSTPEGVNRLNMVKNAIHESDRLINETAAGQTADATALMTSNALRNRSYNTNVPSATKLAGKSDQIKSINKGRASGDQFKNSEKHTTEQLVKEQKKREQARAKAAHTGNSAHYNFSLGQGVTSNKVPTNDIWRNALNHRSPLSNRKDDKE